jgi:hypothetical protein
VAVIVSGEPAQILPDPALDVTLTVGIGLTLTVTIVDPTHVPLDTATVYIVVTEGETTVVAVVEEFGDHEKLVAAETAFRTADWFAQMTGDELVAETGNGATVTTTTAEAEPQPFIEVSV